MFDGLSKCVFTSLGRDHGVCVGGAFMEAQTCWWAGKLMMKTHLMSSHRN